MADPLADLRKMMSGSLDADLKKLADQQAELLKAQADLKRYIKMAEDAKKPSAYPADLVGFFKKAGIKYGDKDSDQKKNVQLLQDKLRALTDQQAAQMFKIQEATQKMQQTVQMMSALIKDLNKATEAAMRGIR